MEYTKDDCIKDGSEEDICMTKFLELLLRYNYECRVDYEEALKLNLSEEDKRQFLSECWEILPNPDEITAATKLVHIRELYYEEWQKASKNSDESIPVWLSLADELFFQRKSTSAFVKTPVSQPLKPMLKSKVALFPQILKESLLSKGTRSISLTNLEEKPNVTSDSTFSRRRTKSLTSMSQVCYIPTSYLTLFPPIAPISRFTSFKFYERTVSDTLGKVFESALKPDSIASTSGASFSPPAKSSVSPTAGSSISPSARSSEYERISIAPETTVSISPATKLLSPPDSGSWKKIQTSTRSSEYGRVSTSPVSNVSVSPKAGISISPTTKPLSPLARSPDSSSLERMQTSARSSGYGRVSTSPVSNVSVSPKTGISISPTAKPLSPLARSPDSPSFKTQISARSSGYGRISTSPETGVFISPTGKLSSPLARSPNSPLKRIQITPKSSLPFKKRCSN